MMGTGLRKDLGYQKRFGDQRALRARVGSGQTGKMMGGQVDEGWPADPGLCVVSMSNGYCHNKETQFS